MVVLNSKAVYIKILKLPFNIRLIFSQRNRVIIYINRLIFSIFRVQIMNNPTNKKFKKWNYILLRIVNALSFLVYLE
jgi:hypothetical protein